MIVKLSGTSYDAALADVPVVSERKVGFGRQVTLEAPDNATRTAWIDRLAEAACDKADQGDSNAVDAIYRDLDKIGV